MIQFPYIEASGSYSDIGRAIGSVMKFQIQKALTEDKIDIPNYFSFLEKSKKYFHFTQTIFPQYLEELEAIAQAAEVDKFEYFFSNNREVYDVAEKYDLKKISHDHCTICLSRTSNSFVIGHNEDWDVSALDSIYLLKATVNDTSFFSLNYAGAIPGVAAGINSWGLIQCINDLYQFNQFGVPKNFLARAILESHSITAAIEIIKKTKRGSGFNHVLVQGNEAVNIEIAGNEISLEEIVADTYVHTNHYLSPQLQHLEKFHTPSSESRLKRAKQLATTNMTPFQMQSLLSDTYDSQYPICRQDETIASLVFDIADHSVYISRGHPCSNSYHQYKF